MELFVIIVKEYWDSF